MRNRQRRVRHLPFGVGAILLACAVVCALTVTIQTVRSDRAVAALEREIHLLSSEQRNLEMCVDSYHDLERIEGRARALGMENPQEGQLRTVNLPGAESVYTVSNVEE